MKIAPEYSGPVVHVLDASRAVDVVSSLLERRSARDVRRGEPRGSRTTLREQYATRREKPLLPYAAGARQPAADRLGRRTTSPSPSFLGRRDLDDVPLAELVPFIDWTFFFAAWELKGRFPAILEHPQYGAAARELYDNAQALLDADRRRASC